ncbi:taste receptor type 2 member 7-like [Bufo bufo]|uniref:taste receptor type 2 member 7-like n=1 Tax=Bufo bufo TaxID=8384 RepID=UPI001ABDEDC2|nr:taste receptor type 2 member 7-like [Bufo bufo]
MADSTEGYTEFQHNGLLPSALIALLAGLVIHSFIIASNVYDWWEGRSVTPVDHIVTSLGISQMCSQCANTLDLFLGLSFIIRNVRSRVTLLIIDVVYAFFTGTNVCLTALLSIVFCLKISNFHTRLFLYLRRMILQRTVFFIVASVLLSFFNCLMALSMTLTEVTKDGAYKITSHLFLNCSNINNLYHFSIGCFFPLLFYYFSSILLFSSLYYHATRMKMNKNVTINLETYYSAMKFVSFTFIYNTVYSIGHFLCAFYYYLHCVSLPWLFIFLGFLPALHSSYLIYRTAKLRNRMSKVLQNVIDFLFQKKD